MRVDDIPLFSMLKGRLGYLNQRQKVISQNVANADVSGYTPKDLKAQDFSKFLGGIQPGGMVAMTVSQPGHMTGGGGFSVDGGGQGGSDSSAGQTIDAPDSETKMNGNSVVLEEQMLKMAESRMAYDAAIGFYTQSLNMLRMAARKPGG